MHLITVNVAACVKPRAPIKHLLLVVIDTRRLHIELVRAASGQQAHLRLTVQICALNCAELFVVAQGDRTYESVA